MSSGTRYDKDKNRLTLIPAPVLWELGELFTWGCQKYGARNWEKGLPYTKTADALLRHLLRWLAGKNRDSESGMLHLTHVVWNAVVLLHFALHPYKYKSFDDRPQESAAIPDDSSVPLANSSVKEACNETDTPV